MSYSDCDKKVPSLSKAEDNKGAIKSGYSASHGTVYAQAPLHNGRAALLTMSNLTISLDSHHHPKLSLNYPPEYYYRPLLPPGVPIRCLLSAEIPLEISATKTAPLTHKQICSHLSL